jgi:GNAT superfamily N-acetyltransferase
VGGEVSAAVSSEAFRIRAADASDRAYVLRSWFEGARQTHWARDLGPVFFAEHGRVLEAILDRAACRIAHVPSEPTAILGFAVLELPDVLHWVHVRHSVRGQGIAKALVWSTFQRGSEVQCSHWPALSSVSLQPEHGRQAQDAPVSHSLVPYNFRYNPYRLFPRPS